MGDKICHTRAQTTLYLVYLRAGGLQINARRFVNEQMCGGITAGNFNLTFTRRFDSEKAASHHAKVQRVLFVTKQLRQPKANSRRNL